MSSGKARWSLSETFSPITNNPSFKVSRVAVLRTSRQAIFASLNTCSVPPCGSNTAIFRFSRPLPSVRERIPRKDPDAFAYSA